MKKLMLVLALVLSASVARSQDATEINTILMHSTFKLEGQGSTGTAFVLGRPSKSDKTKAFYVLVTASHVLDSMQGERAILHLRKRSGDSYTRLPFPIAIRSSGKPLWTQHSSADVAVMYVALPSDTDIQLLPTDLLATDATLTQFEVHPGDRLSCLGFPFGAEGNEAGFPILRSGQIASYPLVPMSTVKAILFDFTVFEGNSGGPVFFVDFNRIYGGATRIGRVQFLMGLVSQQRFVDETVKSLREERKERHQLGIAVVTPAQHIRETIDLLPEPQQ